MHQAFSFSWQLSQYSLRLQLATIKKLAAGWNLLGRAKVTSFVLLRERSRHECFGTKGRRRTCAPPVFFEPLKAGRPREGGDPSGTF
jgi:hypothetical protein